MRLQIITFWCEFSFQKDLSKSNNKLSLSERGTSQATVNKMTKQLKHLVSKQKLRTINSNHSSSPRFLFWPSRVTRVIRIIHYPHIRCLILRKWPILSRDLVSLPPLFESFKELLAPSKRRWTLQKSSEYSIPFTCPYFHLHEPSCGCCFFRFFNAFLSARKIESQNRIQESTQNKNKNMRTTKQK